MFVLNGTYVIFLVLFLIFVHLLNEIMLKPVGKVIEKRQGRIRENLDGAKSCMQETQKILAEYQAKLHASRVEAQSIIHTALSSAQKERDEKLKRVQAEGRARLDKLKNELASDRQNLLKSLIHPELELVRDILNKILGETPQLAISEEHVYQVLGNTR